MLLRNTAVSDNFSVSVIEHQQAAPAFAKILNTETLREHLGTPIRQRIRLFWRCHFRLLYGVMCAFFALASSTKALIKAPCPLCRHGEREREREREREMASIFDNKLVGALSALCMCTQTYKTSLDIATDTPPDKKTCFDHLAMLTGRWAGVKEPGV
jgi:hypothetical protein